MKRLHLIIFTLALTIPSLIFSQTETKNNALTWRWMWDNFQYPISKNINGEDYTTGAEITYGRYLNRWFNLAIPLKFGKADLPIDDSGDFQGNQMSISLDALAHFNIIKTGEIVQPYLLAGAGVMFESQFDTKTNAEIPFGLGLNVRLTKGFYLSMESQYRYDFSDNRNHIQHAAGIKFEFGDVEEKISDKDNDGIADKDDKCPDKPGDKAMAGCPDSDGDGVADPDDDCPFVQGTVQLNGCPDSDGDGVADYIDDCPDLPGTPAAKGCPDEDTDGDSVPDYKDKCPDHAGPADKDGCPDSDGDGVADPFDRCPDKVGTIANLGCPELVEEEKEVLEFAMKAVQFETGSAKLIGESNTILKQIAEILGKYPEQKLQIDGHTDSIGTPEENLDLSNKRAKACFDYLVKIGVPASKISYTGYGESQPIESNMYAPGREKNRRVEFKIFVE